jgi:cyanophycinase
MSPANTIDGTNRGYIIPIGGAEEKLNNPEILDSFVDVCGGKDARIGIIPTASELEDTGRNYEKLFRKLGVKHAQVLHFVTREDCQSNEDLQYIDKCDGVTSCVFLRRLAARLFLRPSGGATPRVCMLPARRRALHSCRNI